MHDNRILYDSDLVPGNVQFPFNRVERIALKLQCDNATAVDENVKPTARSGEGEAKGWFSGNADSDSNQSGKLPAYNLTSNYRYTSEKI